MDSELPPTPTHPLSQQTLLMQKHGVENVLCKYKESFTSVNQKRIRRYCMQRCLLESNDKLLQEIVLPEIHSLHRRGNLQRENYSGGKITETTLQPEMFVFPILAVLT